jgi:hypothetical protein
MYEYISPWPWATVSISTTIGFDWPFQFANWSAGMGRTREVLI